MKERALIAFTLVMQMAVGTFWMLALLTAMRPPFPQPSFVTFSQGVLVALGPLILLGVLGSLGHLAAPRNAWRALFNLRASWLSREILGVGLFGAGWAATTALCWLDPGGILPGIAYAITAVCGLLLIYAMGRVYMLRTVPAWNSWLTPLAFLLAALTLGSSAMAMVVAFWPAQAEIWQWQAQEWMPLGLLLGVALELLLHWLWAERLAHGAHSAQRAGSLLREKNGRLYFGRFFILGGVALATMGVLISGEAWSGWFILTFGLVLAEEIVGRFLFYETNVREGV